jgi:hypothetical protein
VVALLAGCGRDDAISQAAKKDASKPGMAEIKAIAEERLIYGLPVVMTYKVMHDYAVDRNSPQFKALFNQIKNEHRVFTYEDTSVITPNSDTPYSSMFMDLRAEPMVLTVQAVDTRRYYSVMLTDGNTFNLGYMGSRATGGEAGDYLVAGPDWKGETPPRNQEGVSVQHAVRDRLVSHPALQPGGHAQRAQGAGRLRGAAAVVVSQAGRARGTAGHHVPKIDDETLKTHFFDYLDFALQFAPPGPEEEPIRAQLARIGIGAGKTFNFKDLSLEHKAEVALGMKAGEERPRPPAFTATTPPRPSIPSPRPWPMTSRSTAASTTTPSPPPPASTRRSTRSGR